MGGIQNGLYQRNVQVRDQDKRREATNPSATSNLRERDAESVQGICSKEPLASLNSHIVRREATSSVGEPDAQGTMQVGHGCQLSTGLVWESRHSPSRKLASVTAPQLRAGRTLSSLAHCPGNPSSSDPWDLIVLVLPQKRAERCRKRKPSCTNPSEIHMCETNLLRNGSKNKSSTEFHASRLSS